MGVTEPYLRKHYSKYLNRLATPELMKMNNEIGLGGTIIPDGEDFFIPDIKWQNDKRNLSRKLVTLSSLKSVYLKSHSYLKTIKSK